MKAIHLMDDELVPNDGCLRIPSSMQALQHELGHLRKQRAHNSWLLGDQRIGGCLEKHQH